MVHMLACYNMLELQNSCHMQNLAHMQQQWYLGTGGGCTGGPRTSTPDPLGPRHTLENGAAAHADSLPCLPLQPIAAATSCWCDGTLTNAFR